MSKAAATDVVARGSAPHILQLPGPIYFTEWIDSEHVLVGAGGGGKRFEMANCLVLLRMQVPPTPQSAATPVASSTSSSSPSSAASVSWTFVDALDLGEKIPWCSTSFVRVGAEENRFASTSSSSSGSVVGVFVVSSVDAVTYVRVLRASSSSSSSGAYALEVVGQNSLNSDEQNPDKKPLASVKFEDAERQQQEPLCRLLFPNNSNNDSRSKAPSAPPTKKSAAPQKPSVLPVPPPIVTVYGQDCGTLVCSVWDPSISSVAADETKPQSSSIKVVATLAVATRINDISIFPAPPAGFTASEQLLPKKGTTAPRSNENTSSKKPSSNAKGTIRGREGESHNVLGEFLVASLLQTKQLHLSLLRCVRSTEEESAEESGNEVTNRVTWQWVSLQELDGVAMHFPFPLLRSSLKFVRLFPADVILPTATPTTSLIEDSDSSAPSSSSSPAASKQNAKQEKEEEGSPQRSVGKSRALASPQDRVALLVVAFDVNSDMSYVALGTIARVLDDQGATAASSSLRKWLVDFAKADFPIIKEGITCVQLVQRPSTWKRTVSSGRGASLLCGTVEGTILLVDVTPMSRSTTTSTTTAEATGTPCSSSDLGFTCEMSCSRPALPMLKTYKATTHAKLKQPPKSASSSASVVSPMSLLSTKRSTRNVQSWDQRFPPHHREPISSVSVWPFLEQEDEPTMVRELIVVSTDIAQKLCISVTHAWSPATEKLAEETSKKTMMGSRSHCRETLFAESLVLWTTQECERIANGGRTGGFGCCAWLSQLCSEASPWRAGFANIAFVLILVAVVVNLILSGVLSAV